MDEQHAKKMMDAFYKGKRIRDQLPALPEGVAPSYINMLDAISELSQNNTPVRVSDVAKLRGLPVPGVTRTLKEMEKAGLVQKNSDPTDHRVIHLTITEEGLRLREKYVLHYFSEVTQKLPNVSNKEIDEMVNTIDKIGRIYGV